MRLVNLGCRGRVKKLNKSLVKKEDFLEERGFELSFERWGRFGEVNKG